MHYRLNQGDLQLPQNWTDETLYIFKSPDNYNLVINSEVVPPGVSNKAHLAEQLTSFKDNLPDYEEIDRQSVSFAGEDWPLLTYSWTSPESKMFQVNLMHIHQGILTSFTFSSTQAFSSEQTQVLLSVLRSYELAQEKPVPELA